MRLTRPPASGGRRLRGLLSRGMERVLHRSAWKSRHYQCAWAFVQKELGSTVRAPKLKKPGLWRHGFLGESWVLYDLARNDRRLYLPDYARFTRTRLINGGYAAVLDNKLIFDRFLGGRRGVLPRTHGILRNGRLLDPLGIVADRPAAGAILGELGRGKALVLKPLTGGGGHGIAVLNREPGRITLNGSEISEAELRSYLSTLGNRLVCEFVTQHEEIARLYPQTTNTVRLLTMQDEDCEAFVAAAVLRIGTQASWPTDNWTRGGLSAGIDVESGKLGQAVAYPADSDSLAWHARHPDSGAEIAGMTIPHWQRIHEGVLEVFRALPVLKYVGWDVVVTEDGFCILEGNNYSDVNLLQVHRPLLADPRARDFYRRQGVLQ